MKKTVALILTLLLCIIALTPNFSYASNNKNSNSGGINTGDFTGIYSKEGTSTLQTTGGKILGIVRVVGVACGVICLLILGIKYMIMSSNADDKATIKEKLIPYAIGAILLFGGSGLLTIIANFAQSMNK